MPHEYEVLFGDAGVYARSNEVKACLKKLVADAEYYDRQVKTAWDYVEKHFGHSTHIDRLKTTNTDLRGKLHQS